VNALGEKLAARIRREGPISFSEYQAAALYDEEHGFFARGAGAGRAGHDFITSPAVGSLFGAVVARYLDDAWQRLGAPDPFVVVEAGAGNGRLAADVLRAEPACAGALRYVLVERSPELRAEQRERLSLEPADEALGPFARASAPDEPDEPVPDAGPIATSLDELPAVHIDGVVLANELLDNLPVDLVERTHDGWDEIRLGLDLDGALYETTVPAAPSLAQEADAVAAWTNVPAGERLPVPRTIQAWFEDVSNLLRRGEILIIDYADDVRGLLERGMSGWLRTYRAHERGSAPFDDPGEQDITCDVPLEYLRAVAQRAGLTVAQETTQSEWLRGYGIDELVATGEETWRSRAHLGDLEAIAGRSRAVEASALLDESGLGAHRVMALTRAIA
jgi:SAM-dependent MidA family methyltransferase